MLLTFLAVYLGHKRLVFICDLLGFALTNMIIARIFENLQCCVSVLIGVEVASRPKYINIGIK